jgi:triosephosphate isomerase
MAQRLPLIAANWKMNTTLAEGGRLCSALRDRLDGMRGVEVVLCPPFTHLVPLSECVAGSSLALGAQNLYWEPKGAYTGEISAAMLQGLVQYVILGHSERRGYFGESDADVNRKLQVALAAGLKPIVCVGEAEAERDANATEGVLRRQVRDGLGGAELNESLVLAYEPLWAIGTGRAANGEQAQAAIGFIRSQLHALAGPLAARVRILYGGSVTPANIAEFMAQPDVDGALVGGASLVAESFAGIVEAARTIAS